MLPVLVTVRCDGAVASKLVAPDAAEHGRDLFDDPPPTRASKAVFCVLSTNHCRNKARVRVVKPNCRVEHLENGEVVGTHEVFGDPCEFDVIMWKKKGMDGSRGFRITTALYTDPVTGQNEWRTLPENCWFEAIFEGLHWLPEEEAPGARDVPVDATPAPCDEVARAIHTPEQKARLRANLLQWRAHRRQPPTRLRPDALAIERCKQALRRVHDLMRRGEWFPKGVQGDIVEVSATEIANRFVRLYQRASYRLWILAAVKRGRPEAKYWRPQWLKEPYTPVQEAVPQKGPKTAEERLFGEYGVSPGVSRFAAVIDKYENQSYRMVGGVLPSSKCVCTPESAFNVRALIRTLPPPKRVWDNLVGIDRTNKCIMSAIESVQNYVYCIRAWKRIAAECGVGRSTIRKSKQLKRLTRQIKRATRSAEEWKAYIRSKIETSFGKKKLAEGIPCFVRKDKGSPAPGHVYEVQEGSVVGFNDETRCTIIAVKNGPLSFQKEFYLPDVHVHFTSIAAAKPVKQRASRGGGGSGGAEGGSTGVPLVPFDLALPQIIRKRKPMSDGEDDEIEADPKRRRPIADDEEDD